MIENIFVGRKVYFKNHFERYAEYHGHLIGCEIGKDYYVDNKYIVFEKKNNKFYYLGSDIECNVLYNLDRNTILQDCFDCKSKGSFPDCSLELDKEKVYYGISNIMPIAEVANTQNLGEAINFVLEYNNLHDEDLNKRLVLSRD